MKRKKVLACRTIQLWACSIISFVRLSEAERVIQTVRMRRAIRGVKNTKIKKGKAKKGKAKTPAKQMK